MKTISRINTGHQRGHRHTKVAVSTQGQVLPMKCPQAPNLQPI